MGLQKFFLLLSYIPEWSTCTTPFASGLFYRGQRVAFKTEKDIASIFRSFVMASPVQDSTKLWIRVVWVSWWRPSHPQTPLCTLPSVYYTVWIVPCSLEWEIPTHNSWNAVFAAPFLIPPFFSQEEEDGKMLTNKFIQLLSWILITH